MTTVEKNNDTVEYKKRSTSHKKCDVQVINRRFACSQAAELVWQKAFRKFIIDKKPNFVSTNNKIINILSLGKHNCFEGPDFINACLMVDEKLVVGDIEFHKKSSGWKYHKHHLNKKYSNVVLHIVFDDDKKYSEINFETVVIAQTALLEYTNPQFYASKFDYTSYEDFQKYAMFRLMRRTVDISLLLQNNSITDTFIISATKFLNKYFSFRKRPSKMNLDIPQIINYFLQTPIFQIQKINSLNDNLFQFNLSQIDLSQFFRNIMTCNFSRINNFLEINNFSEINNSSKINKHLKQEIIVNVFLPLIFCIANSEKKSELLLWYWSAKTKTKYGILSREFSLIKQEYIWLQQGMLEFMKEFNNKNFSKKSELLINYNIPDIIPYYTFNYLQ